MYSVPVAIAFNVRKGFTLGETGVCFLSEWYKGLVGIHMPKDRMFPLLSLCGGIMHAAGARKQQSSKSQLYNPMKGSNLCFTKFYKGALGNHSGGLGPSYL